MPVGHQTDTLLPFQSRILTTAQCPLRAPPRSPWTWSIPFHHYPVQQGSTLPYLAMGRGAAGCTQCDHTASEFVSDGETCAREDTSSPWVRKGKGPAATHASVGIFVSWIVVGVHFGHSASSPPSVCIPDPAHIKTPGLTGRLILSEN